MPVTLAQAMAAGWRPTKIRSPRTVACQAGCGRYQVLDGHDGVRHWVCESCRRSYTGYVNYQRRSRRKPPQDAASAAGGSGGADAGREAQRDAS